MTKARHRRVALQAARIVRYKANLTETVALFLLFEYFLVVTTGSYCLSIPVNEWSVTDCIGFLEIMESCIGRRTRYSYTFDFYIKDLSRNPIPVLRDISVPFAPASVNQALQWH